MVLATLSKHLHSLQKMSRESEELKELKLLVDDLLRGIPDEDQKVLSEAANASLTASVIHVRLRTILTALLTLLIAFFCFYVIFFIVMEDKQWYDWVRMWEILVIMALALCISSNKNIARNLKILIMLSFIAVLFDIVATTFVTNDDVDAAVKKDHKRNVKEILYILSFFFLALDATSFVVAVYYRQASSLQLPIVKLYFESVESGVKLHFAAALLYVIKKYNKTLQSTEDEERDQATTRANRKTYAASLNARNQQPVPKSRNTTPPAQHSARRESRNTQDSDDYESDDNEYADEDNSNNSFF